MLTCNAVVDASRARLFVLDRRSEVDGIAENFGEVADLVNPARRQTPAQLFSETRPGSSRVGSRQFTFDDHRDAHIDALDMQFARTIADAVAKTAHESGATRIIMCAPPRMLGELRTIGLTRDEIVVDEVAHDYVKLAPLEIRQTLADLGLLAAVPQRRALHEKR